MTAAAHFRIRAQAEPQTLARLVNYFAQLGLVSQRVRAEQVEDIFNVSIEQPDIDDHQAQIIAERMRSSVLVKTVELRRGRRRLTPLSEQTA